MDFITITQEWQLIKVHFNKYKWKIKIWLACRPHNIHHSSSPSLFLPLLSPSPPSFSTHLSHLSHLPLFLTLLSPFSLSHECARDRKFFYHGRIFFFCILLLPRTTSLSFSLSCMRKQENFFGLLCSPSFHLLLPSPSTSCCLLFFLFSTYSLSYLVHTLFSLHRFYPLPRFSLLLFHLLIHSHLPPPTLPMLSLFLPPFLLSSSHFSPLLPLAPFFSPHLAPSLFSISCVSSKVWLEKWERRERKTLML